MSTTTSSNGRRPRAAKVTGAAKRTAIAEPVEKARRDDVALDLDALEREDTRQPFTFLLNGHVFEVADPRELDWQDQLRVFGDPIAFLKIAMSEQDIELFLNTKMAAWKLDKILEAWREHYALPSLGE